MDDWNGLPPDPSKKAFYWLNDNRGDEVPCRWIPTNECEAGGCWKLWGDFRAFTPAEVSSTCEYVAEVMTTEKAGELANPLIKSLKEDVLWDQVSVLVRGQ